MEKALVKKSPASILILVDDYLPDSTKVAAKMMHELAVEFLRRELRVTVVTPSETASGSYDRSTLDGIDVIRFKSGPVKNTSMIRRAINETLLPYRARYALRHIIRNEAYDLIVYFSPTIFWGPLVKSLKRKWKCISYLVLRDFFPQWAIDQGLLSKNSAATGFFRYFERITYESADMIGIQPPTNLAIFNSMNARLYPVELLYNWAGDLKQIERTSTYRKKFGLGNKIVFFYGGNIGPAQGIENILELVVEMQDVKQSHFFFVGSGESVPLLTATQEKHKLRNMTFIPAVPQSEFAKLQSEFDIGLFSLQKNHTTHNIPGKLLGYLSSGMPILGCVNKGNDLKEIINERVAGLVTEAGDIAGLVKNARELLKKSARLKMGKNALRLKGSLFSVTTAADKILASYKQVRQQHEASRTLRQ